MRLPDDRRARTQERILRVLEKHTGKKIDWDNLPEDFKRNLEPYVGDLSQKPELRMQNTMNSLAVRLRLRWSSDPPSGHPYDARLDGQLLAGSDRLAVVELEARIAKQVRGALLDLITHPAGRKLLVIGASEAVPNPEEVKKHITERVLPALQHKFHFNEEVGVFTESELREAPKRVSSFLGLTSSDDSAKELPNLA
jgi:hypothetical protein